MIYVELNLRFYDGSYLNLKTCQEMRGLLPAVVSVVGPTGVYLLDFFYSSIQLYILLNPYLCFISFLYLHLYLIGDDTSIS